MATADELAALLSEGLNLCVRARKMDAMDRREATLSVSSDPDEWVKSGQFDRHVARHNAVNPDQPFETRSLAVAVWVQDQYEKDLADWERRGREMVVNHIFGDDAAQETTCNGTGARP